MSGASKSTCENPITDGLRFLAVACLFMGQLTLSLAMAILLCYLLYGVPAVFWRPVVGIALATLLLSGAAQILRISNRELQVICWMRAVLISCLLTGGLALRKLISNPAEHNMSNMVIAIVTSAIFVSGVLVLKRYNKPISSISN